MLRCRGSFLLQLHLNLFILQRCTLDFFSFVYSLLEFHDTNTCHRLDSLRILAKSYIHLLRNHAHNQSTIQSFAKNKSLKSHESRITDYHERALNLLVSKSLKSRRSVLYFFVFASSTLNTSRVSFCISMMQTRIILFLLKTLTHLTSIQYFFIDKKNISLFNSQKGYKY